MNVPLPPSPSASLLEAEFERTRAYRCEIQNSAELSVDDELEIVALFDRQKDILAAMRSEVRVRYFGPNDEIPF